MGDWRKFEKLKQAASQTYLSLQEHLLAFPTKQKIHILETKISVKKKKKMWQKENSKGKLIWGNEENFFYYLSSL